ncbi:TPA_exp: Uncharacterized protein A8136_1816 [Trichophyton benhamiae CBS 112371]|uniref:Uncharacterized protein n=1 Tax=Arthroderma benhamiae (strain ATCC MYA-4681 / CBS 112371) TaxID=663331 RepID=D4AXB9_ARTBC|nr:uncharacterized protein ARB_00847 [Trichophyton benhamiae CBS 112371]EFE32324.1 hypothetical protein ARB_00847 [Trichophyton benhamiae CBS 112371]DAA75419.1 TPA_exp: Uncharacterized protein A8136_1816 [Trichophyton benhamiae CBS 112371]
MGNVFKLLLEVGKVVMGRPGDLRKFFAPTAERGKTVWPKKPADFLRYGVRWDYDGVIKGEDGKEYYKYQLQPNAGKIPSTIKAWRENNGGTHAVIATMYIEKGIDAKEEIFEQALRKSLDGI